MHTETHAYIQIVCVYKIMDIFMYLYVLSVPKLCKKVLTHFASHETFKLRSSFPQEAQHALFKLQIVFAAT